MKKNASKKQFVNEQTDNLKNDNIADICSFLQTLLLSDIKNAQKDERFRNIERKIMGISFDPMTYAQCDELCKTIMQLTHAQGRIIRSLESIIWKEIYRIPFQMIEFQGYEYQENETLEPNVDYEYEPKKVLSRLLQLCIDTLAVKQDKTKATEIRRAAALQTIAETVIYFKIPDSKKIFAASINSHRPNEQFFALFGLENYYQVNEEPIDDELLNKINDVFTTTDDRTIASTCLQIQINAGIIDEIDALMAIEDKYDSDDENDEDDKFDGDDNDE